MSVFRKENGSLVKKAGRALVDLALSLTSNNAVANSAVTNQLSANNNIFKAAYQNGKYGFMIDGTFYEIGGNAMYNLDYSGFVNVKTAGSLTPSKDGRLIVNVIDSINGNITINGKGLIPEAAQSAGVGTIHFDLPIKAGDVIVSTFPTNQNGRYSNIDFIPYR